MFQNIFLILKIKIIPSYFIYYGLLLRHTHKKYNSESSKKACHWLFIAFRYENKDKRIYFSIHNPNKDVNSKALYTFLKSKVSPLFLL